MLQAHYRKPLDFAETAIVAAERGWQTLKEAMTIDLKSLEPASQMSADLHTEAIERFQRAMDEISR